MHGLVQLPLGTAMDCRWTVSEIRGMELWGLIERAGAVAEAQPWQRRYPRGLCRRLRTAVSAHMHARSGCHCLAAAG